MEGGMGRKQRLSLNLLSNLYLPSLLSFSQSPTLLLSEMGIQFSKRRASGGGTSGSVSAGGNMEIIAELSSNEAAIQVDPDIQTFVAGHRQRNSRFISDLFFNVQLPFDFLNEAAGSHFDMNQDVIRIKLESKKNKWKNFEKLQMVDDYFKNSIRAGNSFTALDTSFKKASDSQPIVEQAIKSFHEEYAVAVAVAVAANEEDKSPEVKGKTRYAKTLDELRRFKAIGDPFTNEIYEAYKTVYQQQLSILEKLQNRKVEQDKKLKSVKIWRNVTCIIFLSVIAALLIWSVVAAVVEAPHIAAALAAANAIPLVFMGQWFDSMWKEYQDALEAEKELINTMHAGTSVVLTYLNSIKILVNPLEDNIRSDAEFVFKDEDVVRLGIKAMENMVVFMKSIKNLVHQVDRCSRVLRTARTMVLQRIIELPN